MRERDIISWPDIIMILVNSLQFNVLRSLFYAGMVPGDFISNYIVFKFQFQLPLLISCFHELLGIYSH